jgi:hypothetical protein
VIRIAVIAAALAAAAPYHSSVAPLSKGLRAELKASHEWHRGCPVGFDDLRVLTVTYWGFDGHAHRGQLVTNKAAVAPLAKVFHRIYRLHFRIHHMSLAAVYGPRGRQPKDGDPSGSFECRDAVPSPCSGGRSTGHWSMHAYGLAVDINPVENPYVGCGQSRDPAARPYFDRSRHRRGMVTPAVVAAFRSVGWGWGGSWSGNTKDYMHFSSTGH